MADIEVENRNRVIIIGAGAAGIAAAVRLVESNFTNVVILEAENRLGGRINSVPFVKGVVDLGAEYCVGEKGNSVYDLVSHLDLLDNHNGNRIEFYHSSQPSLDTAFVEEMYKETIEIYMKPRGGVGLNLGEYANDMFKELIMKRCEGESRKVELAHELFGLFKAIIMTQKGVMTWSDIAAQSDYKKVKEVKFKNWKEKGFKMVLDVLARRYPDSSKELPVYSRANLNKEVRRILVDEVVEVECCDNTTYKADHVIWTPSLGVLKNHHQNLFEPALPQQKVEAINALGMETFVKIFIDFPEKWWPDHVEGFGFIWNESDRENSKQQFFEGLEVNKEPWVSSLQLFMVNPYNPKVLTTWVFGESAPNAENLDDDVIMNGLVYVLNKFLGHKYQNITRPAAIKREKWYSNEHFRGVCSYDTLESRAKSVNQRDVLSEPIKTMNGKPVILFAGEATNSIHFSTVHGAIETGRREADRLINYYKDLKQ